MKRKFKSIISLVLCFIMFLPISAFAGQSADDYINHWAGNQIKSFLDKGFITVDKDGNFKPNDPVTRADFAAIANRAFSFTEKDETNFKDVKSGEYYYNDILIAKKAGYLVGLPDGTVLPKGYMSRQEYALIISRLLKLDITKYIEEANSFADAAVMPDWSKGAIGAVSKAGYMQGEPGNVFNPRGFITRGQAVAVLERCYLDNVKVAYNKPGTYSVDVIEGNVAINSPDVKLENTTVTGNLIIGEGVGDGTVRLRNVIVKGDTIVKGGGLNSIIIEDSQIKNIIIIKEDNKIRIVAVGTTTIEQVDMQSGGKLEEQGTAGTGFSYVTIAENVDPNELIILMGNFDSVQVQADGINLNVASGSVTNMSVAQTATNTQISLGTGTSVTNMVVDSVAVVTGTGTIGTAQVNVQGTTITAPTTTTNTATGVTVATSLPTPTQAPTPTPATTPAPTPTPTTSGGGSGGGGGGGGGSNDDNINVSAVAVTGTGNVSTITTDNGTLQMVAAVTPTNATNKTVTWSVTNGTGYATISNRGLLKAVSNGTVTVKATANDGSGRYGVKEITIDNQVPTVLFTSSKIANGAVDPDIVVTLINDTFTADGISNLSANWTSNLGTTGLTVGTITRDSDTQMTFHMSGTAQVGTLTLRAKAAAIASGADSNDITVFVLGEAPAEVGTIEVGETINGVENIAPFIDGQSITFDGKIAYYLANESNVLPISGNWIGVKITAPEDVTPDENAVLYVNGRIANFGGSPGWNNIREESDGDDYFHLYQRITDISRVYNIVIKWNNAITEAYTIDLADTATLESENDHGTIEVSQPVLEGGEIPTAYESIQSITFDGELDYYTNESNGLPASGNWVGVKITAPEGVYPDENAVLTIDGEELVAGWNNIKEQGDGDNYFHLYLRVRNIYRIYDISIKWNEQSTERYFVNFAATTTLGFSESELTKLGNMINDAEARYDIAVNYGDTSVWQIEYLRAVIDEAQEIYDDAATPNDATMQDIYYAQVILIEAMEEFDAYEAETVVTVSPELDETVADAVYYNNSDPLVITLSIDGIGEFNSELENNIILGGVLSEMQINLVTIEGNPANIAVLELTGTIGDGTGGGNIVIAAAGVNGHDHGFSVEHGKIERAETINGQANAAATIDGLMITFTGQIAYYTAGGTNSLPEPGNYVGVKITTPLGVIPDGNAVLTAYGDICNRDGEPGWDNIKKTGDGDNYFYLYQRIPQNRFIYEIKIKWNNDITETYYIRVPGSTTLEAAE